MEKSITSFDISNDTKSTLTIIHEPECFEFHVPIKETVTVEVYSCRNSILLRQFIENDKIEIAIVGDKSLYRVMHKGVDVFREFMDDL